MISQRKNRARPPTLQTTRLAFAVPHSIKEAASMSIPPTTISVPLSVGKTLFPSKKIASMFITEEGKNATRSSAQTRPQTAELQMLNPNGNSVRPRKGRRAQFIM